MPFYRQLLQSYLISKTVRFFWPTMYIELIYALLSGLILNDLE